MWVLVGLVVLVEVRVVAVECRVLLTLPPVTPPWKAVAVVCGVLVLAAVVVGRTVELMQGLYTTLAGLPRVWCAFFHKHLHSRMPLVPIHARLKLLHACDQ
jgi:hypothetical protein